MPDCDNPRCHEQMVTELNKRVTWDQYDSLKSRVATKMPKTWLRWWWAGFAVVGIPLIAAAIGVWSGQQNDVLRYANKTDVVETQIRLTRLEECRIATRRDIEVMKCNQAEMLKLLRENKSQPEQVWYE